MLKTIESNETGIYCWNCKEFCNLAYLNDRKDCFHIKARQNLEACTTHYCGCHDVNDGEDMMERREEVADLFQSYVHRTRHCGQDG